MRYQRKKIATKSGDSGGDDDDDDQRNDELNSSKEFSLDAYPFLSPTSAKFPRKTTAIGGSSTSSSTKTRKSTESQGGYDEREDESWEDYINARTESTSPSSSSVYSYVSYYNSSVMFCLILVFHFSQIN